MVKISRGLKKKLIFFLAFLLDFYDEFSIRGFYRRFYLGDYPKERISQTISRMLKSGELTKKIKNNETYIKLTNKGKAVFKQLLTLKKLSERQWDGHWRLVIFDIEEKNRKTRDFLRQRLKEIGFFMWQKSIYISPHPLFDKINEYLKIEKLFPKVICLETKKIGIDDSRQFARQVFQLDLLKKEYQNLSQQLNLIEKGSLNKKIDMKGVEKISKKTRDLYFKFQQLVLKDPFLPKALLIGQWPREKLKNRFIKLFGILKNKEMNNS